MLRIANFEIETSKKMQALIWGKLVINAAINPLTALLRIKNGGLLENPHVHSIMVELASEAASVAKACGIMLPFLDPEGAVEKVARQSADNLSSMLQDVLRGAPTEVDAINGMIVRLGEKNNVSVPVNRVIWLLINGLSVRGNIYRLSTGGV
jgi:2-dehydropantoate 2-reductase